MKDLDWKILVTLYQNKNITKTANLYFLSQPTLTKRIQLIEKELETQLIIRNNKGITFTQKGEMVVKYGERILNLLDEMHENLSKSDQWDVGTVKIGISGSIANYVIPGFFTEFSNQHPKLQAEINDLISDDTIKLVTEKKLDFGFICSEIYSTHIAKFLIRKELCYLVSKEPIRLEDLPHTPRIFIRQNEYSTTLVQNWWNEHFSDPPEFAFKARSGDIAVQMIEKGLCFGLIYFRGKDYFASRGLYYEPLYFLDGMPLTRNCWLIYNRSRENDPLVVNFMKAVKSCDFSRF